MNKYASKQSHPPPSSKNLSSRPKGICAYVRNILLVVIDMMATVIRIKMRRD